MTATVTIVNALANAVVEHARHLTSCVELGAIDLARHWATRVDDVLYAADHVDRTAALWARKYVEESLTKVEGYQRARQVLEAQG